jgi:hypothetical protein
LPIEEQAELIDSYENIVILNWKKWALLSDQEKIWEVSQALLVHRNEGHSVEASQVDAFVDSLFATSAVFSKYKFFDHVLRSQNTFTFKKPFIPVANAKYDVGYEYWCWYGKPCEKFEYQPWLKPQNPDLIASGFCRLLGFQKMIGAHWSRPMPHSLVPGLDPSSKSLTLAEVSEGIFNGTFQTHAYGAGYTVILESVSCEKSGE